MTSKIATKQQNQNVNQDLKLKTLSVEAIKSIIKENHSKNSLTFKLFPSPQNRVHIVSYLNNDFYHYLESIEPNDKLNLIFKLFHYISQLRNDLSLLELASSIQNTREPLQLSIQKMKKKLEFNDIEENKILEDQIDKSQKLLNIINASYNVHDIDWIFIIIAQFMKSHFETYYTEQLLWSFCNEYFETDDLKILSSQIKDDTGIEFEVDKERKFPYKEEIPINAHVYIEIDNTGFTDCVEVSIAHFFYMVQPVELNLIDSYWDAINSPLKEKIKNFFHIQGPKRANNENSSIREIWAEIVSRIPGMIYKKKTDPNLILNDVEIKAGWFNYLKAIAHLKNNKKAWDELCELMEILTEEEKISPSIKERTCKIFSELAGDKLESIEWRDGDYYEGIRDMEDGTLDLLGRIRCSFKDAPEKIDFVMMDGHGYVQWNED